MKHLLYSMACMAFFSCGNNDNTIDDPKPIDKDVYHFQFKYYRIKDTVLYQGSTGKKSTPEESYLNTYWEFYKEPAWKQIELNMKSHSITLISGTSEKTTYPFTLSNDSVLIHNNNAKPDYIGDFDKNNASFTLKRTFRYIKKVPRNDSEGLLIHKNSLFGTTEFQNIFGTVFTNPADMTKSEDQILWTNIEYTFSLQ
ncbi:hypothetical protein H3Z85_02350 [Chryseobacterium indologenes]|uniref:hypothetical protein n=1 Tax=Chryseobacterium indologenes TaxID=253 RepID=UPI0003E063D2|nr:hypothetical protein [Chryseobacterium indologenes]QPQ52359.1 hypothetical protein H3Z85_02350 [Chryseobacterium indologenes]GAE64783.1 hypothetical protein CIN01S_09_02680 [Chryseobacterium indologenes NBRC 14944]SFJ87608.1 hypothetical protein SAMN05421692_2808 [Chryseobacterium indologenes]SUX50988.1 Uncharacterised protein [Chryseobacterium indologenes]